MSRIRYRLGIFLSVVLIVAGAVYIYFTHYAPLKPDADTEVTVWYVNNDRMWQGFAGLADNYNNGEGGKYGITVKVRDFNSSSELYKELDKRIEEEINNMSINEDYKTRLQEEAQKSKGKVIKYHLVKEEGPAHDKVFYVDVYVNDKKIGEGNGKSKKEAEQKAAKEALQNI